MSLLVFLWLRFTSVAFFFLPPVYPATPIAGHLAVYQLVNSIVLEPHPWNRTKHLPHTKVGVAPCNLRGNLNSMFWCPPCAGHSKGLSERLNALRDGKPLLRQHASNASNVSENFRNSPVYRDEIVSARTCNVVWYFDILRFVPFGLRLGTL